MVQGFMVQGFMVQGFMVQGFKVQGFKVQGFKGLWRCIELVDMFIAYVYQSFRSIAKLCREFNAAVC